MKGIHSILIPVTAAALLAGCSGKSGSGAQGAKSANTATNGFGGYVTSLRHQQKKADKTIDVTAINQALQLFNVQEGRYPKNLQELVPNYMPKIPPAPDGYKIVYDSANGTVKVVAQP